MAFVIGLILAIIFNVDTINIAQKLWQDPTIREVLVAQAQNQSSTDLSPSEVMAQAKDLNFPIGWTTSMAKNQACGLIGFENNQLMIQSGGECRVLTSIPNSILGFFYKILGFFLSGLAASQGAPFWFDVLKKLVSVRTTTQTTTTTSTPATTNTSSPATTTTSTQTTTTAPAQTTTTTAPQVTPPPDDDILSSPDSQAVG